MSAIGETVPVGETTQASGWCSLSPFNYDVVFDLGAKTVLFTPHAEDGDKRVSILGDSYSTMVGWMTPSSNICYYSEETPTWHEDQDINNVNQLWCYKAIYESEGYALERNNSYSGATMVNNPLYIDGERMDMSTTFISRAENLGNPDVILVCGGANDNWNSNMEKGEFKYSDWTEKDKT